MDTKRRCRYSSRFEDLYCTWYLWHLSCNRPHCSGFLFYRSIVHQRMKNTLGVQGVFDVTPEFVDKQLESVLLDIGTDAVKTGMLWKAPIISTVAQSLKKFGVKKLVLDPVMASTTGSLLLAPDAKDTLL